MKTVKFNDVSLRDGHQSLLATRMSTKQTLYVLEILKEAPLNFLEIWGGATLDTAMRFLNEDPWERLEKAYAMLDGKMPIRALCRGQNLFGYSPYPDEVVRSFNIESVKTGVGVMRVFDALNDANNLKTAVSAIKEAGGVFDAALSYTTGKVFTVDYFVNYAKVLESMGADMISIKDMAGLLTPDRTFELITRLHKEVKVPLCLHTHTTPGYAHVCALIGLMLDIDQIDTAFMSMSGGSSHPSIELMTHFAKKLGKDVFWDHTLYREIDKRLRETRLEMSKFDILSIPHEFPREIPHHIDRMMDDVITLTLKKKYEKALKVMHEIEAYFNFSPPDDLVRDAQIPGGMYTNMVSQLEPFKAQDRINEVMKEIPKVREESGYPPLVTPTSQIVGVQAVMNVVKGRYAMITAPFKAMVEGRYGKTPVPIKSDFRVKITGSTEEKLYEREEQNFNIPYLSDLDVELCLNEREKMLYYLFPQTAEPFLKARRLEELRKKIDQQIAEQYAEITAFSEKIYNGGWF